MRTECLCLSVPDNYGGGSYVLEYILDTIDEADILQMAESVKARGKV